jgi:hypothetical protein
MIIVPYSFAGVIKSLLQACDMGSGTAHVLQSGEVLV